MFVSKLFNMEVTDRILTFLKGGSLIRMEAVYFFLMRASNTILVCNTYLSTQTHLQVMRNSCL